MLISQFRLTGGERPDDLLPPVPPILKTLHLCSLMPIPPLNFSRAEPSEYKKRAFARFLYSYHGIRPEICSGTSFDRRSTGISAENRITSSAVWNGSMMRFFRALAEAVTR